MAERRMFAKTIIDSDAFLEMPMSARLLYYDLAMRADDDGFVNSPKKIMRMIGASQDDMSILILRKFIIPFDNGIVVIKHWKIHNYIRKDMYHETKYKDEKALLGMDENNAYTLNRNNVVTDLLQERNEVVTSPSTQVRLGKDSIGKDKYICAFEEFWKHYPRKKDKARAYKCYCARLNDGYTEDQLLTACINYAAECELNKTEERYIKHGATFLSVNEPFLDYLKGETENAGIDDEEQRNAELDEHIRRVEAGEYDAEDEELHRLFDSIKVSDMP